MEPFACTPTVTPRFDYYYAVVRAFQASHNWENGLPINLLQTMRVLWEQRGNALREQYGHRVGVNAMEKLGADDFLYWDARKTL